LTNGEPQEICRKHPQGLRAKVVVRAKSMKARCVVFDAIDILLDLLPDPN